MNTLEKIAGKAGRVLGAFRKGIGAMISDESAWTSGRYWGAGTSELNRPFDTKEQQLAQYTSWAYICARHNARAVASVPLRLYVKRPKSIGPFKTWPTRELDTATAKWLYSKPTFKAIVRAGDNLEEVTDHPFLRLLQQVNPQQNRSELWEATSTFLDLTGEAYWFIVKNRLGVPVQLWVIPSSHLDPIPGKSLTEPVIGYLYKSGSFEHRFAIDEIIPFFYVNPANVLQGFSCVRGIADAIWVHNEMYQFERALFRNRARTGGVVETSGNYSEDVLTRLEVEFQERYGGAAKSGRSIMLPQGMKYIPDTQSPSELSFNEGKRMTREEICAGFDVPIACLVATDVNRANAETADYRHAKNGVLPRLVSIEQKLNERVMPLYDPNLICAFDNPVPADKEFEVTSNIQYAGANIKLINEVRADLGLAPVAFGKTGWMTSGMTAVEAEDNPFDELSELLGTRGAGNRLAEMIRERMKEWLNGLPS